MTTATTTPTCLFKCDFCVELNEEFYMYWVQGREPYVDAPNCCADCVEEQDDGTDDDSDSDDE